MNANSISLIIIILFLFLNQTNKEVNNNRNCTQNCTINSIELTFYSSDSVLYIDNKLYEFVEGDIFTIHNAPEGVYSIGNVENYLPKQYLVTIFQPNTTINIIKK